MVFFKKQRKQTRAQVKGGGNRPLFQNLGLLETWTNWFPTSSPVYYCIDFAILPFRGMHSATFKL